MYPKEHSTFITLFVFAIFLLFPVSTSASSTFRTVTPEQYGADGFDSRPDTEALQKAFNSGADSVVLKEGSKYIIDRRITINQKVKITSGNKKAKILQKSTNQGMIYFRNRPVSQTVTTKRINKGSSFITVQQSQSIKPGDIIELKSNKLWKWDNRGYLTKGEIHKVKRIVNNKVYLTSQTDDSYGIGKEEKVTVNTYTSSNIIIENVDFTYTKPSYTTAIIIDPSLNSKFSNISIKNSKLTGLKLIKNINARVERSNFNLGTTKDVNTGYGIQDYGGIFTKITNSNFEKVRRGVDFSGDIPSRHGLVEFSKAIGPRKGTLAAGNSGFGTHSTAENILFKNNYVKNFDYHFVSRGNNIRFIHNTGAGITKAFMHTNYGDQITVANNKYLSENKNRLDYFILRSSSFNGSIKHYGNRGRSKTYIR